MKKIVTIFILLLITIFSFSCKDKNNNKTQTEKEKTKPILNTIDFSFDKEEVLLELGENSTIVFNSNDSNITIDILDFSIASFVINDNVISIKGEEKGNTKLVCKSGDKVLDEVEIKVIEKVIFIPLPTNKLLLKGIDESASVKVIITLDGYNEDIIWEVEDPEIVSIESQDRIARFTSLKIGSTEVVIRCGEYSNTFTIYVTDIRGDID